LKAEGEDRCCWFEGRRPGCGRRRRKALSFFKEKGRASYLAWRESAA
jgi:hypothetical protein